jgi:hypothetical protein
MESHCGWHSTKTYVEVREYVDLEIRNIWRIGVMHVAREKGECKIKIDWTENSLLWWNEKPFERLKQLH